MMCDKYSFAPSVQIAQASPPYACRAIPMYASPCLKDSSSSHLMVTPIGSSADQLATEAGFEPTLSESKSDVLTITLLGYDARGVTMPLAIKLYIKGFHLRLAHATRNHHQGLCRAVGDRRSHHPLHRTCTFRTMCYRNYSGRNRLHMVVYRRLLSISINLRSYRLLPNSSVL